jgi:phosphoribosylformimino-5-aminoimidazole carboxamide ribotide isomerase
MELVLAMDLKGGLVVHGERGDRMNYHPLTYGASPVADPVGFISYIRPRSIYIADLDRIMRVGTHDSIIITCNELVRHCYADRGCRGPEDLLNLDHFENVIGTETAGPDITLYHSGYLSIDMKDGRVIPTGMEPVEFLRLANKMDFEGCILLDISGVGTSRGLVQEQLVPMRTAFQGNLIWGGGVASLEDLEILSKIGFDGVIIATALHKNKIPVDMVRRGIYC